MSNRRLVSIMFADIAGYTAIMQQNESEALKKVKRFREVLDELVPAFEGQVIQYYGDGSLMIFDSAVKAVQCGREIQLAVRSVPTVPLRIGIHIGDIVIDGENVYGDGVNMAARVESLGVPGAVLFTDRIINDIHNHPDLEVVSKGKFHFKNAKTPTEVFALANEGLHVPDRKDMQGKLEPEKKNTEESRKKLKTTLLSLAGIVALILGLTGFSLRDVLFNGNSGSGPMSLTVYVHGPEGKQDVVLESEGMLLVDFGNDRRSVSIGQNGRTNLGEIPKKFANKRTMLNVQAEEYQLAHPDSTYLLNGEPIYLGVKPKDLRVTFAGQVLDENSLLPIVGARVMSEGVAALTDSLGNFSLILPKRQTQYLYRMIVTKDGYQPLNERRAYAGSQMELRLREK